MFTKDDMGYLSEIFSMARVEAVKTQPNNRKLLEGVLNFESMLGGKLVAANEKLGYVEPEPEEKPEEESTENVADQGATD